jgi:DNA modification methylase
VADATWRVEHGDCLDVLAAMAPDSIDAIVTDGPYGIGFMGREWDTFKASDAVARVVPNRAIASDNPNLKGRTRGPASSPSAVEYDYTVEGLRRFQAETERWAREAIRVLKPGAYLINFGAPRAYHRMACGLEDGGFVIRDKFAWLFGSGFPKSLDLGDGKGTALKPGHEPIVVAWKPFKGTITACHEKHGTAALYVEACRLGDVERVNLPAANRPGGNALHMSVRGMPTDAEPTTAIGRWPANVLLDEEAAAMLDEQSGELVSGANPTRRGSDKFRNAYGDFVGQVECEPARGLDVGGASRFFYVAKPSRAERDMGTAHLRLRSAGEMTGGRAEGSAGLRSPRAGAGRTSGGGNFHPTVKPIELMQWLIRLVTPPGGTVLDPFTGSGTTGMAARLEGRPFIGIEREADYVELAKARIHAIAPLFSSSEVSA